MLAALRFVQESKMKHFSLAAHKSIMRGVFYPTGHMVLMFPTEQDARLACKLLQKDGVLEEDLSLATPQEFERQITGATNPDSDWVLPSVGTEGETAEHFRQLAHEGHYALFVHAGAKLTSDHVMDLLKDTHITYGQRYRYLVIEDLVG
jgi:hypothetical protein